MNVLELMMKVISCSQKDKRIICLMTRFFLILIMKYNLSSLIQFAGYTEYRNGEKSAAQVHPSIVDIDSKPADPQACTPYALDIYNYKRITEVCIDNVQSLELAIAEPMLIV